MQALRKSEHVAGVARNTEGILPPVEAKWPSATKPRSPLYSKSAYSRQLEPAITVLLLRAEAIQVGRYAIEVLRFPARQKVIVRKCASQWEFFNVDYNAFRLFQLAVLFRSAISTHEAFEHVVFAEAEPDRMRYQLNSGVAPDVNQYPCLMEVLVEEGSPNTLCERIIGSPKPYEAGSQKYIWFVFGGFSWYFVFPKLSPEELTYESYVSKGGYMRLPTMIPWQHPWLRLSMARTVVKSFF
jgi:hypothetical protein